MTINKREYIIKGMINNQPRKEPSMLNSELFRETVENHGMKYKFIAKELGISAQSLNSKMSNKREFTANEIGTLCELLRIKDYEQIKMIFFAK